MSNREIMLRAIALAKKAINPSPNPRVGALVLRRGKIVGAGWHERAGEPHAEIIALRKAGAKAVGGELFVTLEPCHHVGRTPPCSRAIVEAGIRKVVIGMRDFSKARGGIDFLRKNGVAVKTGICESECRELNQIWLKNVAKKLPFVALKLALDETGSTIPARGKKWISNKKSRREVMKMRRGFDAILVGVNTILEDNPRLNVRGLKVAKQPLRIVLDGSGRIPKNARVLKDGGRTLVMRKLDLKKLWKMGITSIFVEGGEETAKLLLEKNLVDQVWIFQKNARGIPRVCGKKLPLKKMRKFGEDTLFEAKLKTTYKLNPSICRRDGAVAPTN